MDWNNINRDRDTSGLGPIEYDQSKVPSLIRKHADNVRTKTYGQEVREAQARNAELAGLIASEASSKVDTQNIHINDLSGQFNNAINGVTTDTEIIDARLAEGMGVGYQTLKQRLDATVVYTPEMFGAIGDGVTDDYVAFKKMSEFISTRKSANILFGKGKTYYLDLLSYAGEPSKSLSYTYMKSLKIDLNGSTIKTNGDYAIDGNAVVGVSVQSSITANRIFDIAFIEHFEISNGFLHGNNQDTSQVSGYIPNNNSEAISIGGCDNVVISNLKVTNFSTDGVRLRSSNDKNNIEQINKKVFIVNSEFNENGRNNISFTGNQNVYAINSKFNEAGKYIKSDPQASIDIEDEQFYGENVHRESKYYFANCTFNGSKGLAPVVYGAGNKTKKNVTFDNCLFDFTDGGAFLGGDCSATFNNCNLVNATIAPFYGQGSNEFTKDTVVLYSNCKIEHTTDRRVIIMDTRYSYTFKMKGNKINATGTGTGTEPGIFYALGTNQNNSFEDNDVFIGSGNVISAQSRYTNFATFQNFKLSGNSWSTDNTDSLRFLWLNLTGNSSISGDKFTTPDFISYLGTKKSVVDTIYAQKMQEAWIIPTFTGSWKAVNTVAYRKDEFGRVEVKGTITGGAVGTSPFSLPGGYRPLQSAQFIVPSSGSGTAKVIVQPAGAFTTSESATDLVLDGISFPTT